ncbi:hypothetical protein ACJX0J_026193, partial [Zea mays]
MLKHSLLDYYRTYMYFVAEGMHATKKRDYYHIYMIAHPIKNPNSHGQWCALALTKEACSMGSR